MTLGLVALARAIPNWLDLAAAFTAPGPNTVGEAGKVYFAHRIQTGLPAFADAGAPPYYPSFHGALLHATVGYLGKLLDASISQLYPVGRWISLGLTLSAVGLMTGLGRALRLPPVGVGVTLILWSSCYALLHHSVSYRPDNWLLAVGALACWLMVARGERRSTLVILAVLPAVGFHLKATALVMVAAIGLAHLLQGKWRRAILLGLVQIGIIGASVAILDGLTDGAYLAGLRGAGGVPGGPRYLLVSLFAAGPLAAIWLFGPLVLGTFSRRAAVGDTESRALVVVASFWLVTLVGYGLAAMRAGSYAYYFLEPASFGALLVVHAVRALSPGEGGAPHRTAAAATVLAAMLVLAVPMVARYAEGARGITMAQVRTERLASHREALAARVNDREATCYSDDPGL
ncbi:MAG TPA: hypothetical protein VLA43_19965, partial [Longimicrobiales bacterium]|nr:hypothetical protein [Longimicrobiales bacterium]